MATSLLLMASDQATTHDQTMKPLSGSSEELPKTEPTRNRGRRANNGKGPNQKKQPQRGLGVAQLESLRIQETLKKMHETSPLLPLLSPLPLHDPFARSVPLRYGAPPNHGPLQCPPPRSPVMFNGNAVIPGSGSGPSIENRNRGGFNVLGDGGIGGWLLTNQVNNVVDSYGFGAPVWSPLVGSPLETSKELSSMPNAHSESQHCDVCLKKKRFNEDNIVKGSNTRRDKSLDIWPTMNDPDFLGFSPQQAPNLAAETTDFTTRTTRHDAASYSPRNPDEFVEVVAVHRKGSSTGGRVFMEYEFFPGKDYGRGTTSKELELPTVGAGGVGGEASSSITAAATTAYNIGDTTTASNSVDLSLKLSY